MEGIHVQRLNDNKTRSCHGGGAIAVVILAHSKDQAAITNRCKGENCTVTTLDKVMRKKFSKNPQQGDRSGEDQMILDKKDKILQAARVKGGAEQSANKKPSRSLIKKPAQRLVKKSVQQRLAKKPSQRLDESPPQRLVENSPKRQYRRPRREDDPFLWQDSFN